MSLARLRLGAHNLEVEIGRHREPAKVPLVDRICKHCSKNSIEDEFHAVTECSKYQEIRSTLFTEFTDILHFTPNDQFLFMMSYNRGGTEIVDKIMSLIRTIMLKSSLSTVPKPGYYFHTFALIVPIFVLASELNRRSSFNY